MTELSERLCLNLTDTLSGYLEFLAHFLQGSCPSIILAKAQAEHLLFSVGQSVKHFG